MTAPAPTRPYADDWREAAVCAQTDPEAYFPIKGGSARPAKQVCAICPVRTECLDDALATDERHGVRGGLSARESRPLLRQRRKA